MQTSLAEFVRQTGAGREADSILRACVHCGFCNATCPTYQLAGDELDGPRGRIYLIKQVLEGNAPSATTQLHLDRCLTCRSCETTCPSGVRYGRLIGIGRELVEQQVRRSWRDRARRAFLRSTFSYPRRFAALLRVAQWVRPVLSGALKRAVPPAQRHTHWPAPRHTRRVLMLAGCVQPALAPNINAAAARVLDRLGISAVVAQASGCCGALSHHTSGTAAALEFARRNVDAWWPHVEAGAEAIVTTASGCGVHVKDYGEYLRDDPAYAVKARAIAERARDLSEILARADVSGLKPVANLRVAFQSPCTLQHGQQLGGTVEQILRRMGASLTPVPDAHLCCGSAGTYSILNRGWSTRLRAEKLQALTAGKPDVIASANIGCLVHLQQGSAVPVRHWIELVDAANT